VPLIEVTLGAGRTDQQVRDLIHEVHAAVARTTGARPDHIRVIVREVPRAHWATGDVTLSEMDAAAPSSAPSTTTVSQEPS
jgi:4-oxalocrotonate tautomerase